MTGWQLPNYVDINGRQYKINADYRDILDIIQHLDKSQNDVTELYIAVALFYDDYESISEEDLQTAVNQMMIFINCGEEPDEKPHPKRIDWQQDRNLIIADVNKVAACEVRSLPFCHWWTFIAWFNSIGEGQLSTVVSIREKLRRGKKLEKWEQEYYAENKSKIDLKKQYSEEEICEINRLSALLGK